MSLIFEALKKLDREKQAPERGFLVVGASAWGAGRRLRLVPIALAVAAAGLSGFLFAQWASRPRVVVPSAAPPPPSVAPRTGPPATYAPPFVPPAAQTAAPASRTPPPGEPPSVPAKRAAAGAATSGTASPPADPAAHAVDVAPAALTLEAVTQQDGVPVAIVNGQLVRVGDVVEGARILRIDAEAVEVEKDGRRYVIGF